MRVVRPPSTARRSISNYLAAFGDNAESQVYSLIVGNLQTQVFHQQSDTRTNSYAAELLGRSRQFLTNASNSYQPADWGSTLLGHSAPHTTAGVNEVYEYQVQPGKFAGLLKGGPPLWAAEAIVYPSGRAAAPAPRGGRGLRSRSGSICNFQFQFQITRNRIMTASANLQANSPKGPAGTMNVCMMIMHSIATSGEVFIHRDFGDRYFGLQALAVLVIVPIFSMLFPGQDVRALWLALLAYICFVCIHRSVILSRPQFCEAACHSRITAGFRCSCFCSRCSTKFGSSRRWNL